MLFYIIFIYVFWVMKYFKFPQRHTGISIKLLKTFFLSFFFKENSFITLNANFPLKCIFNLFLKQILKASEFLSIVRKKWMFIWKLIIVQGIYWDSIDESLYSYLRINWQMFWDSCNIEMESFDIICKNKDSFSNKVN